MNKALNIYIVNSTCIPALVCMCVCVLHVSVHARLPVLYSTHCIVLYMYLRLVLNTLTSTAGVLDYLHKNDFLPVIISGDTNGIVELCSSLIFLHYLNVCLIIALVQCKFVISLM